MAKNSCRKKPKFSEILGTKVVQFWCYIILVKKCAPKLILFNKNFFRKVWTIFDIENWLWKSDFGTFWPFRPFNKCHEKIKSIFVIGAIIPSIWNVFIKFHWHDEKFTLANYLCFFKQVICLFSFLMCLETK